MRPSSHLKTISEDSAVAQDDNWMLSYIDVFVLITTLFLMLLVMRETELPSKEPSSIPTTVLPEIAQGQFDTSQSEHAPIAPALLGSEDKHPDTRKANTQNALSDVIVVDEALVIGETAVIDKSIDIAAPHKPFSASAKQALGNHALQRALERSVAEHRLESHIKVVQDQFKTRLEIQSRVLFDSGDAYLTRSGEALLEKLLPVLQEAPGNIVIEGHTDNQPINTLRFPSNWNLAAARASEVLEFFVSEGFEARRFRAVSYGDTQPLVDNSSEANRRKNRRVSLVIEQLD